MMTVTDHMKTQSLMTFYTSLQWSLVKTSIYEAQCELFALVRDQKLHRNMFYPRYHLHFVVAAGEQRHIAVDTP